MTSEIEIGWPGQPTMNPRTQGIVRLWNDENFQDYSAKHVKIHLLRLTDLADGLAGQNLQIPDWNMPAVLPSDNEAFARCLPYISAINFSFTNPKKPHPRFQVEDETGVYTGSQAMCRCFYRRFQNRLIQADSITNALASERGAQSFFRGATPIPLLTHRIRYLLEVARNLRVKFDDDWKNLFEAGRWRAFGDGNHLGIVDIIEMEFPKSFGQDCFFHSDKLRDNYPLRFSKRAQLWLMIYQGRALANPGKLRPLDDGELLGPIADSAIPNALRACEILAYNKELTQQIDDQIELLPHSSEVKEIRMATVAAMQKLLSRINLKRSGLGKHPTSMLALDNALWRLGRNLTKPAHLAQTTDY